MSSELERDRRSVNADGLVALLWRWYHVPVLGILMAFMFWTRTQAYEAYLAHGEPIFAAVDSWYHWRTVLFSVENFPSRIQFEVFTGYPFGNYVGQFGTLFDLLIAGVALLVGGGSPTEETVFQVALLSVPAMAALCAIPVYLIGRRLGGRIGGLSGVLLLALFPQTFFFRTTVGQLQHHVAEVLFMTCALLAMMVAVTTAEREKPVYEQLVDRDLSGLRTPTLAAVAAGVALALYIWVWPSGVVLVGIFGAYFLVQLVADYLRRESPDHVAFVGAVALSVTGALTALTVETTSVSATNFSYMQPVLAFAVAGGCVVMAGLARLFDDRGIDRRYYPAAIGAAAVAGLGLLALVLPSLFDTLVSNLFGRVLPIGHSETQVTIAEAQPPSDPGEHFFAEFGLAFFVALGGLFALLARPLAGYRPKAEHLLVGIWSLFVLSMALTQLRFSYYLAATVAVLCAYVVGLVVNWADLSTPATLRDLEGYQVLVIVTVVLVLLAPLSPMIAGASVVDRGAAAGPAVQSGDALKWEGSTTWLQGNTPEPGTWAGADEELDYYGDYEIPEDEDFAYPEGTYGVMSWWDYGHLITTQGERIPHSNPFQQNARSASAFLLADSEERAELILEAIPTGEDVHDVEDAELSRLADERTDQQRTEEMRYVMIDDEMVSGKFSAITRWSGPDYEQYLEPTDVEFDGESVPVQALGEPYDETMLSGLYYDDASGMEHYRLVHESPERTQFVSVAALTGEGHWETLAVNTELTPQLQFELRALLEDPTLDIEDVRFFDDREASAVKTYERVEGAELVGTADASEGETVLAAVELEAESSERTFTYVQEATVDAGGEFTMTVPYATDNALGPDDGYTDTDVVATGEYTLLVGDPADPVEVGETAVPEGAIYDGERIEVDLDELEAGEEVDAGEEGSEAGGESDDEGGD
ncbi:oligosaccharyl transferase, archaeosortase A system-associated [Natronorarus salvus]|uniref:oligosaccharyl transferase, archaeosortase A system-associated n=1 Tax=Natronorarus salvus TaxID=3117733 RepID=UPI002F26243C